MSDFVQQRRTGLRLSPAYLHVARVCTGLVLMLSCISSQTQVQSQKITVTGKLVRVMAIGGESTGWAIQLESDTTIEGKRVGSIEIDYPNAAKLERLENKGVKANGMLSHRQGVETGLQPVLVVSSIREVQVTTQPAPTFSLSGNEWLLQDLGGSGVLDNIEATLTFPDTGKVAGNGSCNRFFGPAHVSGNVIKLGPLASSRMACPEAVMNQETKYLNALQAAERFEWKDRYLLIYCQGFEKPLRFTRAQAPKNP